MNQLDLNDAIEGAGRRLQPEVDRIVDGAIAGGARQVRRRRRGTALVAFAAVAAMGVGGGWWLQRPEPVDHLSAADPSLYATGPGDAAPASAHQRADADDIRDRLLDMLPDGKVSDVTVREDPVGMNWDGSQRGIEVGLELDGSPMRLQLLDFNRDRAMVKAEWAKDPGAKPKDCQTATADAPLGISNSPAALGDCATWNDRSRLRECATAPSCADLDKFVSFSPKKEVCNYNANYPCRELGDGAWLAAGTGGDDVDRDSPFTMATRATADGWYIYASADNKPHTVLDVDQITAIVTSDAWFK